MIDTQDVILLRLSRVADRLGWRRPDRRDVAALVRRGGQRAAILAVSRVERLVGHGLRPRSMDEVEVLERRIEVCVAGAVTLSDVAPGGLTDEVVDRRRAQMLPARARAWERKVGA